MAGRQAEVAWWLLRPGRVPMAVTAELPEPWDPPVPPATFREDRVKGSAGATALARAEARFQAATGRLRQRWGLEAARLRLQLGDVEGAGLRAEMLLSEDDLAQDLALEAMILVVEVRVQQSRFAEAERTLEWAAREAARSGAPVDQALVAWARARWALEGGRYERVAPALAEAAMWAGQGVGSRAALLKGQIGGLRGRYLADLGDRPGAMKALDAALRDLPRNASEARVGLRALRAFLAAQGGGGAASLEAVACEARRLGLPLLEASLRNNAGCAHLRTGRRKVASAALAEAFRLIRALPEPEAAARVAVNLAAAEFAAGRASRAVSRLLWARSVAHHPLTQAAADHGLMVGWAALGRLDLAILAGKGAVAELQALQGRAALKGPAAEAFRAANAETYRRLADLLIQDGGRLAEAQEVLALLKEDEYGRFLGRDAGVIPGEGPARTGEEAQLAQRVEEPQKAWMALARDLEALRRQPLEALSPEDRAERQRLEGLVKEARQAFQAALRSLREDARAEGSEATERLAARQLERLSGLQGRLGPDTALLSYVMGPERLHILVTTARLQVHREAVVTAPELAGAIQSLRWALTDRNRDPRPEARALYTLLIQPVAADLEAAKTQRLLLDLDGPLRYLPFATLHDGSAWLVERYALAVAARGAFAAASESPLEGKGAAAFGVSQAHGAFSALAAVPAELQGVLAGLQAVGTPGRSYLDEAFTADRLKELNGISIVHVASHFQFRPGTHEASALLVGDGSLLSLKTLRDEGVRFDGVRLLSLSACQTALGGGRDDQGVEVEGLGALALDLGAQSVVATLWKVADASTADLMQDFYRRWGGGTPRAEALRAAQLRLLRKQDTARDWSHPFYWAPFILLGAWR
ncbi:MAG TPA: CHAT domain-containing protein [Holophagaceae bacterium]|nr:CHAT domain-containing protein [Holophagaceae bacterium]